MFLDSYSDTYVTFGGSTIFQEYGEYGEAEFYSHSLMAYYEDGSDEPVIEFTEYGNVICNPVLPPQYFLDEENPSGNYYYGFNYDDEDLMWQKGELLPESPKDDNSYGNYLIKTNNNYGEVTTTWEKALNVVGNPTVYVKLKYNSSNSSWTFYISDDAVTPNYGEYQYQYTENEFLQIKNSLPPGSQIIVRGIAGVTNATTTATTPSLYPETYGVGFIPTMSVLESDMIAGLWTYALCVASYNSEDWFGYVRVSIGFQGGIGVGRLDYCDFIPICKLPTT